MLQIFDLSTLNGSNGFRISNSGAVSNAGDVNGDGFNDIVVGEDDWGTAYHGSSYVIFGKNTPFNATLDPSTLNGNNGFQLIRDVYGANLTTTAGDFNGDGFDDLLVAGSTYSDQSATIFFGKGAGFNGTESLSTALHDNNIGFNITGIGSDSNNSISPSSAGDINGDHIDDIILSYPGNTLYEAGISYVIFGQNSFANNSIDVDSLNGTNGFLLHGVDGINGKDNFGFSLSGAGDVNGDGYDDMIIGSSYGGNNPTNAGSSYVVFGKASGFSATLEMSSLDGTNGFRLDGITKYDTAGNVSSAGDMNGDGFSDILIGAPATDINGDASGSSYVVFGKSSGFDAVMNLADLNGTNGFTINGESAGDYLGRSVSNAGDVNGDGFGDILIGARGADHNGDYSGSVYVIFGKSIGFSATLDLANLASDAGFRIDGLKAGDSLGINNVSSSGDINKDGFDDLMVEDLSNSYIIFGRSDFSNPEKVIKGTNKNDMLVGTKAAERFEAGNGNDTLIGKGGADTYLAGNGNDYIRISDLNFKLVDGGNGNGDTLAIAA
ncbi:MAG: FG-GAP-like repeat-containing protein, partial [Nitrosomonas sp.]|nr:FG-GAP-like repeat-containing protein [Nitrosomonas sp.]